MSPVSWKFARSIDIAAAVRTFARSWRACGVYHVSVTWPHPSQSYVHRCSADRMGSKNHLLPYSRLCVLPIMSFAVMIYRRILLRKLFTRRMAEIRWDLCTLDWYARYTFSCHIHVETWIVLRSRIIKLGMLQYVYMPLATWSACGYKWFFGLIDVALNCVVDAHQQVTWPN